jgi:hypothetical protein
MSSELIEINAVPEIYSDGVGDIQVLGCNARVLFFTWQKLDGVFQRVVVASVVQPVASLGADTELIRHAKANPAPAPSRAVGALQ